MGDCPPLLQERADERFVPLHGRKEPISGEIVTLETEEAKKAWNPELDESTVGMKELSIHRREM